MLRQFEGNQHQAPMLGGPDEDTILRERLSATERVVDGPSLIAELMSEGIHKRRQGGEKRE